MTAGWCSAIPGGIRLAVQVTPNAKRNEAVGVSDGRLKIRLHAQPAEGKANEALIRYFADVFGLSKNAIVITHGHAARRKTVEVAVAMTADEVLRRLSVSG